MKTRYLTKAILFSTLSIFELWVLLWAGDIVIVNLEDNIKHWYHIPLLVMSFFFLFTTVGLAFLYFLLYMDGGDNENLRL